MKQTLYIITLILVFCSKTFAQDYTEYYFKFEIKNKAELNTITQIISIDNVENKTVFAYATDKDFINFITLGY